MKKKSLIAIILILLFSGCSTTPNVNEKELPNSGTHDVINYDSIAK